MRDKKEVEEHWIKQYQIKNALWIHDGNPRRPHALLTSGKHSNGFFNSRLVIPDEVLLREAVIDLLMMFAVNGGDIGKIEGVVGPQTGATKLSEFISDQITAFTRSECFWASPAKDGNGEFKRMVFNQEELSILPSQSILLCEDVMTTGGSIDLTSTAVISSDGIILPYVLVLVNRSGLFEVSGKKIIALINREMPIWEPDFCPLCHEGSEAIPAKDPTNWTRLNAIYETKGEV